MPQKNLRRRRNPREEVDKQGQTWRWRNQAAGIKCGKAAPLYCKALCESVGGMGVMIVGKRKRDGKGKEERQLAISTSCHLLLLLLLLLASPSLSSSSETGFTPSSRACAQTPAYNLLYGLPHIQACFPQLLMGNWFSKLTRRTCPHSHTPPQLTT